MSDYKTLRYAMVHGKFNKPVSTGYHKKRHTCIVCDVRMKYPCGTCGGCSELSVKARYCGETCQKRDWKHKNTQPITGHKFICNRHEHKDSELTTDFLLSKAATLLYIDTPMYQRLCCHCGNIFHRVLDPCPDCDDPHMRFCSPGCSRSSLH
jgi:hypothetical protein